MGGENIYPLLQISRIDGHGSLIFLCLHVAEKSQELNSIKESADVEEKARDDFDFRVYETPVRPDKGAEARIAKKLWHIALEPGLCPGSHGTTVLEHSNPTS